MHSSVKGYQTVLEPGNVSSTSTDSEKATNLHISPTPLCPFTMNANFLVQFIWLSTLKKEILQWTTSVFLSPCNVYNFWLLRRNCCGYLMKNHLLVCRGPLCFAPTHDVFHLQKLSAQKYLFLTKSSAPLMVFYFFFFLMCVAEYVA